MLVTIIIVISVLLLLFFGYYNIFYKKYYDTSSCVTSEHYSRKGFILPYITGLTHENHKDDFSIFNIIKDKFHDKKRIRIVPSSVKPKIAQKVEEAKVTYIGHATHLIQVDGINILTDPVFSSKVGFGSINKQRIVEPAITIADLPKIDYVFISHNHYDHMDKESIINLNKVYSPVFITFLGNGQVLEREFLISGKIKEFDWYDKYTPKENTNISFEFLPSLHYSSRTGYKKNHMLWGSLAIKTTSSVIYFAGDTDFDKEFFTHIKNRLRHVSLAILPVKSSYTTKGKKLEIQHNNSGELNVDDFVSAAEILGCSKCCAMHFGVFQFGNRPDYNNLATEFTQVVKKQKGHSDLILQKIGSETTISD